MPARTVVIEKLEKFNGESHVNITAGEYTQLAGRAGRRGIDIEGHAVVMWRPGLDPAAVAGLASRRTYPLNSSFRPTYNMSVNLLSQFGQHRSRSILESSFAQFQADRSVVGLAREVRNREKSLAGYEESMQCHLGDFTEYARLRRELSDLEKSSSRTRQRAHRRAITDALNRLKVGDIIKVAGPRRLGQAVVVSSAGNPTNPRVGVVTSKAQLRRVSVDDLTEPIAPFAGVELDKNLPLKTPTQRKNVASAMRNAVQERRPSISGDSSTPTTFRYRDEAAYLRIDEVRRQLQSHPCHGCADRESHARWANRWSKLRQETDGLIANIAGRTNTIARTFDRLVQLLASYHYVEPLEDDEHTYQVTERGHTLRRIYGERDLLTSLLIDEGHADQLDPEELTGLAALLVYQDKLDGAAVLPKMPSESLQQAAEAADSLWFTLQNAEAAAKLDITPEPHPGLVWPIMRWARGQDLARTLRGSDLAAGDFVRWARQVIDALDQLANIPGHHDLSRRCRKAKDLIHRGIVSYSSVDKVES